MASLLHPALIFARIIAAIIELASTPRWLGSSATIALPSEPWTDPALLFVFSVQGKKLTWVMLIKVLVNATTLRECCVVNAEQNSQRDRKLCLSPGCESDGIVSPDPETGPPERELSDLESSETEPSGTKLPGEFEYQPGMMRVSLPKVNRPNETGLTGLSRPSLEMHVSSRSGSSPQEWRHDTRSWAASWISSKNFKFRVSFVEALKRTCLGLFFAVFLVLEPIPTEKIE